MGTKGDKTKEYILQSACRLFAQRGFKDVTMKDICEATGLSRGGLYRHYESTQEIFCQIMAAFPVSQNTLLQKKMEEGAPAGEILEEILERYRREMADGENSLSLAVCEYFSTKQLSENENVLFRQYRASFDFWEKLIAYGISQGAFNSVDSRAVFDLILFSYQGVRMYSRLMPLSEDIPQRITGQIQNLLCKKGGTGNG